MSSTTPIRAASTPRLPSATAADTESDYGSGFTSTRGGSTEGAPDLCKSPANTFSTKASRGLRCELWGSATSHDAFNGVGEGMLRHIAGAQTKTVGEHISERVDGKGNDGRAAQEGFHCDIPPLFIQAGNEQGICP